MLEYLFCRASSVVLCAFAPLRDYFLAKTQRRKARKNTNYSSFFTLRSSLFYLLPLTFYLTSCNPTKYVPKDQYLLRSVEVEVDNGKEVKKEDLKSHIRQKPNKKIIGMRFHLWLYNRSKSDKDNRWNRWLRKNGEEPVIWQQSLTDKSLEQLELFLEYKGYYYARVSDTVIFKKRKADVIYKVSTGWPYSIGKVSYDIPDTAIARLILADTLQSLIKRGNPLDGDIFKNEKKRIETYLKNNGYYSFAADYVSFEDADTSYRRRTADFNLTVKPHAERTADNRVVEAPYPLYNIRSITVNAGANMLSMADSEAESKTANDTLTRNGVTFIIPPDYFVRPSVIRNSLYIFPDSLYRISNFNQTYQHLIGLRSFMQVNYDYSVPPDQANLRMRDLDCRINLLPFTRQSITTDVEGTMSEGNLGGGISIQYQNKSLFRHAEIFDLRLRGALEAVSSTSTSNLWGGLKTKMEYEAEASLNIPKFLLPFRSDRFIREYNPKTVFSILYNYQNYPDYYVRTVFSTSVGYNWRGSEVISHIVKPLDVNFVQLPEISPAFESTLQKYPYLQNSYQSHMVVSSSYSFVRDMRAVHKDNFFFVRTNFETAGLLLDAFFKLTDKSTSSGEPYKIFNNEFSQFVKGDVDFRYYYTINGNNTLVSRVFAGVGWPYGNSATAETTEGVTRSVASMPFEKKYYAGGANSIRGWRLRSLGPGSYQDTASITAYPNNTGDIKLEANVEYRFKLVWLIEGALFMDAGNVWDSHKDEDRKGAEFSFDRFYREIALSGGVGLRFNFGYFILRADLGMKLHDPAGSGRWAFTPKPDGSKRVSSDDFCLSIGIGYPFF